MTPATIPARVDFAGGWLDVPGLDRLDGVIVNCAITPFHDWGGHELRWRHTRGVGGSGAWHIYRAMHAQKEIDPAEAARSAVLAEIRAGGGWQDPAVIYEGGCCVWQSGPLPKLKFKNDGSWLRNRLYVWNTQGDRATADLTRRSRDYDKIAHAGRAAAAAVASRSSDVLAEAVAMSRVAQLEEGMEDLSDRIRQKLYIGVDLSWKYLGAGHGGAVLILFPGRIPEDLPKEWTKVQPYDPFTFY